MILLLKYSLTLELHLPFSHYILKFPILHTYPKTESNTPIHTGRGLIKSHFWLEILLKLDHQTIQIKALVCDSECPYDIILGWTSMVQLSAWQDYASHKLYIQQISVPLTVRNNVQVLPGKTGVVSLTLQPNKTSFTPRHTITGKGVAYVKPFDSKLPLRPIEIEFENNRCCIEVHNTSNTTVEFLHGQEMAYFDARCKGLVQINNSKHFPIDQYLHDRMTPTTLSLTPLAYEKPIHPTEMPCITTCTELSVDNENKPTLDDKCPWLESDDIRRNMTESKILRMKLNLKDSVLDEKGKEEFPMADKQSLNKLAKIQNECVKMIGAKLGLITVDVMYKKLGIIPLTKMIQIELAKYGYGITRKTVPSSIQALANRKGGSKSHGYCTRNCNTPNIQKHTNHQFNSSFMCKGLTTYSALPGDIKNISTMAGFVKELKSRWVT